MRSICMQIHFYYKIDRDNVDDRYGLGRIPLGYHSANTGLGAGVERGDHGGILGTDNAQQSSYCQNNGSDTYDRLKDYFGELLAEYPVVLMLDDVDCLGLKTELGVACYDTQSEGNEKHYMGSVHSGIGSAYGEHELTFLTDIKVSPLSLSPSLCPNPLSLPLPLFAYALNTNLHFSCLDARRYKNHHQCSRSQGRCGSEEC
jgi:hypothetical protein